MNTTYLFKTLPKRKQLIAVGKAELDLKEYEQAERLDGAWAICRPLGLDSFQPAYSISYLKQSGDSSHRLLVSLGAKTILSEDLRSRPAISQVLQAALPDSEDKRLTIRNGLLVLDRGAQPVFALSLLPKIPLSFGKTIEACAENLLRALVYHKQTEAPKTNHEILSSLRLIFEEIFQKVFRRLEASFKRIHGELPPSVLKDHVRHFCKFLKEVQQQTDADSSLLYEFNGQLLAWCESSAGWSQLHLILKRFKAFLSEGTLELLSNELKNSVAKLLKRLSPKEDPSEAELRCLTQGQFDQLLSFASESLSKASAQPDENLYAKKRETLVSLHRGVEAFFQVSKDKALLINCDRVELVDLSTKKQVNCLETDAHGLYSRSIIRQDGRVYVWLINYTYVEHMSPVTLMELEVVDGRVVGKVVFEIVRIFFYWIASWCMSRNRVFIVDENKSIVLKRNPRGQFEVESRTELKKVSSDDEENQSYSSSVSSKFVDDDHVLVYFPALLSGSVLPTVKYFSVQPEGCTLEDQIVLPSLKETGYLCTWAENNRGVAFLAIVTDRFKVITVCHRFGKFKVVSATQVSTGAVGRSIMRRFTMTKDVLISALKDGTILVCESQATSSMFHPQLSLKMNFNRIRL